MPVNTTRGDYDDMLGKWERLRDCMGGRDAMIKAGAKYAPDLPGIDAEGNAAYRERGSFYGATARTCQGMVGAIFQRPPAVKVPAVVKPWLEDVTLTGVSFESFAAEAGKELLTVARYGVLVDMPAEEAPGARPYLCGYKAEDIVNWRTVRVAGDEVLTMVVLREHVEVPNAKDPYKSDCVEQYRSLELRLEADGFRCYVQLWREATDKSKGFERYDGEVAPMRHAVPLDFIPFVFMGAVNATPEVERPPLLDLADVNIAHWRNSVDHERGLHLVALPTPWVSGSRGSKDGPMKMGPSVVWELEIQGSAGMLEFAGTGLKALVDAMDEKKRQMATLGARLLEGQASVDRETATAVSARHSGEQASLRTVAGAIEKGFQAALRVVSWWTGTDAAPVDAPVEVELNKEFLNVKASAQEIQTALTALQAGEISFETWWNLVITGGWGREGIDAAEERKAIELDRKLDPEPALDPSLSPGDPNQGGTSVAQ